MLYWSNLAFSAIDKRSFQSTLIGYWPEGSQISKEQESPHFCLSFPPPKSASEEKGMLLHLSLQLLHNNCDSYVYVGGVYISGEERQRAVMTVGVCGEDRKCWITPFTLEDETGMEVGETVDSGIPQAGQWGDLLLDKGKVKTGLETKFQEIYFKLVEYGYGFHELRDTEVREAAAGTSKLSTYFQLKGEPYILSGSSDLEAHTISRTFLGARNLLPKGEMPGEIKEEQ